MPLSLPFASEPRLRFVEIRKLVAVYYDATIQETLNYAQESAGSLFAGVLCYVLFCVALYLASVHWRASRGGLLPAAKRVMFVIAHPDDECMFFGPVITKLAQQRNCELYLLCLSKGNYGKEGGRRKKELWESCRILGIPDSNITLIMSTLLPDDPEATWREDVVANLILNHVEALSIDAVITFDEYGVSNHANHCSLFYAVAFLCVEDRLPSGCLAYALETTSILRKYSCLLDVPISYLTSSYTYVASFKECHTIKRAMHAHVSQLVWFRSLYLIFSRYIFINTLRKIEISDLELDMEAG